MFLLLLRVVVPIATTLLLLQPPNSSGVLASFGGSNNNNIGGNTRRVGARATCSVGLGSLFANMRRKDVWNTNNAARLFLAGAENPNAATTTSCTNSRSGDAVRVARNNNNKPGNHDDNDNNNRATTTTALLVLTTVPVAWGTFEVAIRYIYAVSTIPTLWLTLAYYTVATAVLVPAAAVVARTTSTASGHESWSSISHPAVMEEQEIATATTTTPLQSIIPDAPTTNDTARRGGLELGTYLFVGNLCQVVGLQTIAADRAAFLLQLTTVFVPLAQQVIDSGGLLGESSSVSGTTTTTMDPAQSRRRSNSSISLRVWMACAVALLGVGCMGLDHPHTAPQIGTTTTLAITDGTPWSLIQQFSMASSSLQWSTGDTWIVLAAVSYTFHCLRLEGYAQQTPSAVQLAAWKAITETTWSALAIGTVMLLALATTASSTALADSSMASFWIQSGQDCLDFVATVSSSTSADHPNPNWIPALGAIVWTGLVPVAYTIAAQTYGQRRVRPVTANLIYTLQPVCTALLAYVLLHEQLGPWGYLGGTLIVGSTLLVVFTGPDPDEGDGDGRSNDRNQLASTTKITEAATSSAGADANIT